MKGFTHGLVLALFLVAAIVCYVIGIPAGMVGFVLAGIAFEGLFWFGILGRKRNSKTSP